MSLSRNDAVGTSSSKNFQVVEYNQLLQVLEGSLQLECEPSTTCVRFYVQSDYEDAFHERNILWQQVFPRVRKFAQSLGLRIHIVDIYHTLESEPNAHKQLPYILEMRGTNNIALKEISLCAELSAGTTFMTLIGQKYGHRTLQKFIPAEEFDLLCATIEDRTSRNIIEKNYKLDETSYPAHVLLQQPPNVSEDWIETHSIMSKGIRKAARVAFGKDPSKVQSYVSSVSEDEITLGIFNCPKNTNTSCVWFRRTFTDLYDHKPSIDSSLANYSDVTVGRRGLEFDSETIKLLNYLKEAKLPAKYIGLDSTNIFEFLIKWHKNKGLDPSLNEEHGSYLNELCGKVEEFFTQKLSQVSEVVKTELSYSVYQEGMLHTKYCKKILKGVKDRPSVLVRIDSYMKDLGLSKKPPLVVYGETGSGKSCVMAAAIKVCKSSITRGENRCCVMRFIGLTPSSTSIRRLLASICEQISVVYKTEGKAPADFQSLVQYFNSLLTSSPASNKPLYIFLDGIDQLAPEDGALGLSWLPLQLPPNVWLIVSVSSEVEYRCYPMLRSLLNTEESFVNVHSLIADDCREFLQHMLSFHNRKLSTEQERLVLSVLHHHPSTPLHVYYVALYLKQWLALTLGERRNKNLHEDILNLSATIVTQLDHLEEIHGRMFVSYILACITASRYGLSEDEILDIVAHDKQIIAELKSNSSHIPSFPSNLCEVPTIVWSQLLHDLYPHFMEFRMAEGGVWVLQWKNRILQEIATKKYLLPIEKRTEASCVLADYFSGKMAKEREEELTLTTDTESQTNTSQSEQVPDNSAQSSKVWRDINSQELFLDSQKRVYNVRKMTELPHALVNAGRLNALYEMLSDYQWLNAYIQMGMVDEIINCLSYVVCPVPIGSHNSQKAIELKLLQGALSLSQNSLNENPSQFGVEVAGRLLPYILINGNKEHRSFLKQILINSLEDNPPSLTPIHPYSNTPGGPLLLFMAGHQGPITSIACTIASTPSEELLVTVDTLKEKDSLVIVSGSMDGTLRSWDWKGSGVLKTFDGHLDEVLSVAVTKNGLYAASGSKDKTVRFWYISTAKCLHVMEDHEDAVTSVVVTSEGDKTISGSLDCTIKVWNTEQTSRCKGQLIFTLVPSSIHRFLPSSMKIPVLCLALSTDDTELIVGLKNGDVVIINIVSGEFLRYFKVSNVFQKPVLSLAIVKIKEQRTIMSVSDDMMNVHNYDTGLPIEKVACKTRIEGRMSIKNVDKTSACLTRIPDSITNNSTYTTLTFADSGNLAITGSRDGQIHIWDLNNSPLLTKKHFAPITSLAFSPCGNYIISACQSDIHPSITIWHTDDLTDSMSVLDGFNSSVTCVLPLVDSTCILSAHENGSILLWNSTSKKVEKEYIGHNSCVHSLAVSSDNKVMISGAENGQVILWSLELAKSLRSFQDHQTAITRVLFTPTLQGEKQYFITADKISSICVKDYKTAQIVHYHNTMDHNTELHSLTVGHDEIGGLCLGGSYSSGIIKIWQLPYMESVSILKGHTASVTSLNFLAMCGNKSTPICISTSLDKSIRVWNISSKVCLAKVIIDSPITAGIINPIPHLSTITYGCKDGYIGMFWYHSPDNTKEDNIILKMLNSSTPTSVSKNHTPLNSSSFKTIEECTDGQKSPSIPTVESTTNKTNTHDGQSHVQAKEPMTLLEDKMVNDQEIESNEHQNKENFEPSKQDEESDKPSLEKSVDENQQLQMEERSNEVNGSGDEPRSSACVII